MRAIILVLAAIALATMFVGCAESTDLRPFVAVTGGYGVMQAEPTPTPTPPRPDVCENCGGTGVVGDGVVEMPCPVCRKGAAACKDGKCQPPIKTTRR